MASVLPFSFNGSLSAQSDGDQVVSPDPFGGSSNFTSKQVSRLVLSGATTTVVPVGTAAPVKGMLIEFEPDAAAAAVNFTVNGGTDVIELSPGGFLAYFNPTPSTGITALSVTHTTSACIKVALLG